MKDTITLVISRGKNFIHIHHKGEIIGKIEVSELNSVMKQRTTKCSPRFILH